MTNSFKVKLGQGGFGSVYKGKLSNGKLVAVKILSELKGNGEDFINEVASVGRTSHVNIVTLVGFCCDGHRRALIYEFMPNGSLESGCNTRILHFDIKPHNILLDQDLCPKISDFGLAKLFLEKKSMISMSHIRGTPGYIAPELFSRNFGQVSHKSDVYSYGMMILEMVGGRKNIEVEVDHTSEIYFPHWIYKKVEFHEEQLGLHGIVSEEENEMVRKMIIVGLWCIQTNPLSRPTITKALEMLEDDLASLEIPPKPYLSSPPRHSSAIPHGLGRDEWLQALPRALVSGFFKTDKEFQSKGQTSGTTATFVIVDRWTVTVASVGDSRCILDAQGGAVSELTGFYGVNKVVSKFVTLRAISLYDGNPRERVKASGGEVVRLRILGGAEIGPLRCWPGGLCLSRSIGDMDVGEFIVPIPYVKQVKLSDAGGRLIIASDGIWDAVSSDMAAKSCRGLPAELAARQVVKEALRTRGLKDDTTCIVVDIIPPDTVMPPPSPPRKKPSKFSLRSLFFRKKSHGSASKLSKKLSAVGIVEELFEEGSAMLSERLGNDETCGPSTSGLFHVCCMSSRPSIQGRKSRSIAGSIFSTSSKPWEGPFLCADCRNKKDAMEGKRPSGVKVT
ncbi:probable protein phosphatase 2C 15 [Tanacetum coccineum]